MFGVNNRFIPGFEFGKVQEPATISCHFDDLPLMPGTYLVDLYFGNESRDLDVVHEAIAFEVVPADIFGSGKLPPSGRGADLLAGHIRPTSHARIALSTCRDRSGSSNPSIEHGPK